VDRQTSVAVEIGFEGLTEEDLENPVVMGALERAAWSAFNGAGNVLSIVITIIHSKSNHPKVRMDVLFVDTDRSTASFQVDTALNNNLLANGFNQRLQVESLFVGTTIETDYSILPENTPEDTSDSSDDGINVLQAGVIAFFVVAVVVCTTCLCVRQRRKLVPRAKIKTWKGREGEPKDDFEPRDDAEVGEQEMAEWGGANDFVEEPIDNHRGNGY